MIGDSPHYGKERQVDQTGLRRLGKIEQEEIDNTESEKSVKACHVKKSSKEKVYEVSFCVLCAVMCAVLCAVCSVQCVCVSVCV
jgi:hypothetical protein